MEYNKLAHSYASCHLCAVLWTLTRRRLIYSVSNRCVVPTLDSKEFASSCLGSRRLVRSLPDSTGLHNLLLMLTQLRIHQLSYCMDDTIQNSIGHCEVCRYTYKALGLMTMAILSYVRSHDAFNLIGGAKILAQAHGTLAIFTRRIPPLPPSPTVCLACETSVWPNGIITWLSYMYLLQTSHKQFALDSGQLFTVTAPLGPPFSPQLYLTFYSKEYTHRQPWRKVYDTLGHITWLSLRGLPHNQKLISRGGPRRGMWCGCTLRQAFPLWAVSCYPFWWLVTDSRSD